MKTSKKKIWIGCGILCVLSVLLSSWYAVAYNDSRLVVPMDFKDYVFDTPLYNFSIKKMSYRTF